jgi:hypothetical protein
VSSTCAGYEYAECTYFASNDWYFAEGCTFYNEDLVTPACPVVTEGTWGQYWRTMGDGNGCVGGGGVETCGSDLYPQCKAGTCGAGKECRQGKVNGEWTCKCIAADSTPTPVFCKVQGRLVVNDASGWSETEPATSQSSRGHSATAGSRFIPVRT